MAEQGVAGSIEEAAALADRCIAELPDSATRAAFFDRLVSGLLPHDHPRVFWGDRLLSLEKSMGFLEEPSFAAAYEAIRGSHPYDQYESPHTIAWRLHVLVWAASTGLQLDGDFVECGVFKGDFAWVIVQATDFIRQPKTFYLFDSFSGFSPAYSSPTDFPDAPAFFDFANEIYKDPEIYEQVLRRFRSFPNVRITRGVVPECFTETSPEKIAFLHIDLNSPAAEVAALETLFDRVVPGGCVVFDDYGWHLFRNQKVVEDAFMAARGYRILELPTGQGLVVKR